MTTIEIVFRYSGQPSEAEIFALGNAREVYGIRRLAFDRTASTLLVEYDATRLNAATVTQLVRRSGLQLIKELPVPAPIPEVLQAAPIVDTKPAATMNPSAQTLPAPVVPGPVPPPVPGAPPASTPLR
jgi:hypothetical protein